MILVPAGADDFNFSSSHSTKSQFGNFISLLKPYHSHAYSQLITSECTKKSLPPRGAQTFPKLQIALGFRVLGGKMQLPNISLYLSLTFPYTHVHNTEYGEQTQKSIWLSSGAFSPLPSFPSHAFSVIYFTRNLGTRLEHASLIESPIQITTHQRPHLPERMDKAHSSSHFPSL